VDLYDEVEARDLLIGLHRYLTPYTRKAVLAYYQERNESP
jgi:hypothetical protein